MAQSFAVVLFIVSVLLCALFLGGALFPRPLMTLVRRFMEGPGVAGAVAIRLLLAILLWFSAPVALTPDAFRAIAVVVAVAALSVLLLGRAAVERLIDRIAQWSSAAIRMLCTVGLGFIVFILWSVSPAVRLF